MFDLQNQTGSTFCGCRPATSREGGRLSFLRHNEIYRSDVGAKNILGLRPSTASRWSALRGKAKGRGFDAAPFPSSAMSLGLGIPWQVALQQSLPPLSQPAPLCNDGSEFVEEFSVNGTCLTDAVSQKTPQSNFMMMAADEHR